MNIKIKNFNNILNYIKLDAIRIILKIKNKKVWIIKYILLILNF